MKTCPTCSQVTDKYTEGLLQARLATRPFASPGQVRYITKLESELKAANTWINAKCTIAGCWKSKYEALIREQKE
jgi:NMD protein affecting ribosome stability and mRNA decay